jgi:hypothetical protein
LGVPALSAWALALKTPVFIGYTALRNSAQEAIAQAVSTRLLAVGDTKTWFSAEAVHAPPNPDVLGAFMARSAAAGTPPLVVHGPKDFRHPRPTGANDVAATNVALPVTPLAAKLRAYSPTLLDLEVEAPRDGWLLVNDRWAPGWRAEVNGQPSVVHPADFVFRAVHVKAGQSRIVFRYRPATLPVTLLLCWGALIAVAIMQVDRGWLVGKVKRLIGSR